MTADIVSAAAIPLGDATADGDPFVRVYVDPDLTRAVVALDGDAVDALLHFVDQLGPGYDLTQNPGTYGLDQATADRLADVIGRITGPLAKLKGSI